MNCIQKNVFNNFYVSFTYLKYKYILMILSIDVGLRNLAFCCMSANDKQDLSTYNIELWDVFNTLDSDDYHCEGIQKSGKICGKKCSLQYNTLQLDTTLELDSTLRLPQKKYSCKTHFPKDIKITNQNIFKKKAIDSYLLQDIAKIVLDKIQEIYNNHKNIMDNVTQILIELQPKLNQKMKFTSHIIYGKLVEIYRHTNTTIRFVRASQKLKCYTGPLIECKLKGAYAKRKWLGIQYCKWFLENKFSNEQKEKWLPFFKSHTKADDISDTFLMSINGLFGIPKKQKYQKNGKCIK